MPYSTIVGGTTIAASWANANVRDQVVTPFATTAARDSAISSPTAGMVCYITNEDRFYTYTGSAWVRTGWGSSSGRTGGTWRRVANQSVANNTLTNLAWDTEDADSDGFLTPTGSTITVPSGLGGLYAITMRCSKGANNGSLEYVEVICSTAGAYRSYDLSNNVWALGLHVAITVPLIAGETIITKVIQSTGGAQNYTGRIDVYRLGL